MLSSHLLTAVETVHFPSEPAKGTRIRTIRATLMYIHHRIQKEVMKVIDPPPPPAHNYVLHVMRSGTLLQKGSNLAACRIAITRFT